MKAAGLQEDGCTGADGKLLICSFTPILLFLLLLLLVLTVIPATLLLSLSPMPLLPLPPHVCGIILLLLILQAENRL